MSSKILFFLAVFFPIFAWIILSISTPHFLWIVGLEIPVILFVIPSQNKDSNKYQKPTVTEE